MTQLFAFFRAGMGAIGFWVKNFPTLLRLTWFPIAVLSITGYGWHYWNSAAEMVSIEARGSNDTASAFFLPYQGGFDGIVIWAALQLIAGSAAAVAVHRFVLLGERRPGVIFGFSFGRAEAAYFAMGATAYGLMALLLAGHHLAQLTMPPLDAYLFESTMKPYAELGPLVLSMFIWPGELAIFELPPINYALWCALAATTIYVTLRVSPWPAAVASSQDFALASTLALTRNRMGSVLAYGAAIAVAAGLVAMVLAVAGLLSLASAGPQGLGGALSGLSAGAEVHPNPEIQGIISGRTIALYQEVARFLAGTLGITFGAVLVSRLYVALRDAQGAGMRPAP